MLELKAQPGAFAVHTTKDRGHSEEELAAHAVEKIISIADSAPPELKQQANAFKQRMFYVIVLALKQAVKSDRTTLYNLLKQQGHEDMAEILRKL